jgi:hypothetical protein
MWWEDLVNGTSLYVPCPLAYHHLISALYSHQSFMQSSRPKGPVRPRAGEKRYPADIEMWVCMIRISVRPTLSCFCLHQPYQAFQGYENGI